MTFKDFLKTLTDLELVALLHTLRKDVNDREYVDEALHELGVRQLRKASTP